jgi:hypothetical protein
VDVLLMTPLSCHTPVLRQSMHQLEAIRNRLQKAPTDFGRHREVAVDHDSRAINDLQLGIQFDKK